MRSLVIAAGSLEEERLARYERLRQRLALPRVDVRSGQSELYLTFEAFPPPLADLDPPQAARAIAWLSALEREWGEPLGEALHEGELCYDNERTLFVVGPGLIRPSGSRTALDRLGAAVDMATSALASFGELAAVAASERTELAALLTEQATAEDTIRHLLQLAERSVGEEAVRFAGWALAVRPHDPALAERLTRLWLDAKKPGEPFGVRAVLEQAAQGRSGAAVLLARLARERGELFEARRQVEQALLVSPDNLEAWRLLARVAHAQGDLERVMAALAALARSGDEAALGQLVAQQRWSEVDAILDGWQGPWTRAVLRWQLLRLYQREQLKALVLTFLEHLELVEPGPVFDQVLEAASRLGTLSALRENLWRAVEQGRGGEDLVRLLARVCRLSGVHGPVLALAARHPGVLPVLWVAEALREERHYETLLAFEPERAELAPLRLQAMIQLELTQPGRFSVRAWETTVRACRAVPEGESTLRGCLEQLQRHAPTFGPLPLLLRLAQGIG